jgi:hypothetical protein
LSAETITEARRNPRTNTMLAASLEFDGDRHPVFVRNLSVTGALVEGRMLPLAGDRVVLYRDQHRVPATVIWSQGNRCGLSFSAQVTLDAMIKRPKPGAAAATPHQARIDAIQRALRENRPLPTFDESEAVIGAAAIGKRLVDEIGYAQRLIETVNDTLSGDAYVLSRYGVILQQIDEAEQLLRKLALGLGSKP